MTKCITLKFTFHLTSEDDQIKKQIKTDTHLELLKFYDETRIKAAKKS